MPNQNNTQSEHWKVFALFFKQAMEAKGMKASQLAAKIGASPSTIIRFFDLEFCIRFDYVLRIIHALELNIFFETRDESAEVNKWFESAMEQLGRRPDKLPRN
jgi:ribosome-binding protein aMBF1 (putative translation factor)